MIKNTLSWRITAPLRAISNLYPKLLRKIWKIERAANVPRMAAESSATFASATIPADRLLPGILGLRGIAALAIVLYHLVHIASIAVPTPFSFIATDFGKGVHLFFVLSAFSLMHSTAHTIQHPNWVSRYFIKRFWRIAPLYYCIMFALILWPLLKARVWAVDLQAVILNLTFTFAFVPWKGIVWGGWSVGVEMLFYALFPVLLMCIRTHAGSLNLVALSIIVSLAARPALQDHYEFTVSEYRYNWAYFSFAANLCFFALGMYAFRVAQAIERKAPARNWLAPISSIVILGTLIFTGLEKSLNHLWLAGIILWGIGFAALSVWQSTQPSRLSANRIFEYLGERSYSLYLIHPLVIVFFQDRNTIPLHFDGISGRRLCIFCLRYICPYTNTPVGRSIVPSHRDSWHSARSHT